MYGKTTYIFMFDEQTSGLRQGRFTTVVEGEERPNRVFFIEDVRLHRYLLIGTSN